MRKTLALASLLCLSLTAGSAARADANCAVILAWGGHLGPIQKFQLVMVRDDASWTAYDSGYLFFKQNDPVCDRRSCLDTQGPTRFVFSDRTNGSQRFAYDQQETAPDVQIDSDTGDFDVILWGTHYTFTGSCQANATIVGNNNGLTAVLTLTNAF